mmetsp:Transcript_15584/g.44351  ORF Transcript_15584/g.44351 Transcript_15584/m.44351 type:complete len:263 (+) Transcript_15584:404-1192(+)
MCGCRDERKRGEPHLSRGRQEGHRSAVGARRVAGGPGQQEARRELARHRQAPAQGHAGDAALAPRSLGVRERRAVFTSGAERPRGRGVRRRSLQRGDRRATLRRAVTKRIGNGLAGVVLDRAPRAHPERVRARARRRYRCVSISRRLLHRAGPARSLWRTKLDPEDGRPGPRAGLRARAAPAVTGVRAAGEVLLRRLLREGHPAARHGARRRRVPALLLLALRRVRRGRRRPRLRQPLRPLRSQGRAHHVHAAVHDGVYRLS